MAHATDAGKWPFGARFGARRDWHTRIEYLGAVLRTRNSELRTQNSELRTQNSELRTQNSELRTTGFSLNGKFGVAESPSPVCEKRRALTQTTPARFLWFRCGAQAFLGPAARVRLGSRGWRRPCRRSHPPM